MNPTTTTVKSFCDRYRACPEGTSWALSQNVQTMDELWALSIPSDWRNWIATRPGVLPERDLRLFACWCVRQIWPLLVDERSRKAVEVAEAFVNGDAQWPTLCEANSEARLAEQMISVADQYSSTHALAATAACFTTDFYPYQAAFFAAKCAARALASHYSPTSGPGEVKVKLAAFAAQSKWLIDNTKPNFDLEV